MKNVREKIMHYRPWMAPLRMFFGFFIVLKGLYYIQHSDYVIRWFDTNQFRDVLGGIAVLFAFLHIFLGCLILIGLATRISCGILIPVLLLSVFYTNPHLNIILQVALTVISLLLCGFFMAEGSGRFSVYYYFKHNELTEPDLLTKNANQVKQKQ